jgi:uncharacterized cupin superfamily protein
MTDVTTIAHSTATTTDYEPFTGFDAVISGDPDAGVAWLRTAPAGDGVLFTGMFRAEPSVFRYTFAGDESFHLISGDVEIALDGGETVRLRDGAVASFPKGASSAWTIHRRLTKFFVISG